MNGPEEKTWRDWMRVIVIAGIVVGAFLAPAYVIREQHQETDRIAALIEAESARRLEQAILVNTFTISCLLAVPMEERSSAQMVDCIEAGFDQVDLETPPIEP